MTLETHVRHLLDEMAGRPHRGDEARALLRAIERFADRSPEGRVEVASLAGEVHTLDPGPYPGFIASARGCVVIEPRR